MVVASEDGKGEGRRDCLNNYSKDSAVSAHA